MSNTTKAVTLFLSIALLGAALFLLTSCYELAPFPEYDGGGDTDTDSDADPNPDQKSCAVGVFCYSDLDRECPTGSFTLNIKETVGTCDDNNQGVGECIHETVKQECSSYCTSTRYCPDEGEECNGFDCRYPEIRRYCKGDILHAWNGQPGTCVASQSEGLLCEFVELTYDCGEDNCIDNPHDPGEKMCGDNPNYNLICAMPPASYCIDDNTMASFSSEDFTLGNGICEYARNEDVDCSEMNQECRFGECRDPE